jgi:hypothetical protein
VTFKIKNQKTLPKTRKLCDLCVCEIKNQNNFFDLENLKPKKLTIKQKKIVTFETLET